MLVAKIGILPICQINPAKPALPTQNGRRLRRRQYPIWKPGSREELDRINKINRIHFDPQMPYGPNLHGSSYQIHFVHSCYGKSSPAFLRDILRDLGRLKSVA